MKDFILDVWLHLIRPALVGTGLLICLCSLILLLTVAVWNITWVHVGWVLLIAGCWAFGALTIIDKEGGL